MKKLLLLLFVTFISFSLSAQLIIPGGYVSGTWTTANSPVFIEGDIILHTDSSLIIEPGVDIIFQNEFSFTINGNLQAIGVEGDSIRFTIQDTTGFASGSYTGWNGLYLSGNYGSNNSHLEYCIIEYSMGNGINTEDINTDLLSHSSVRFNSNNGIYICCFSSVELNNIEVKCNKNNGIYITQARVTISDFFVTENEERGIYVTLCNDYYSHFTSLNNGIISFNQNGGLLIDGATVTMDSVVIKNHSIMGSGAGIKCIDTTEMGSSLTGTNCSIINNTATIGGGIYLKGSASFQIQCSLNNTLISNNFAYSGGGIYCGRSDIVLEKVIISHNSTVHPVQTDMGGGIYSEDFGNGCHITMTNSEITNNESEDEAGGVYAGSNTIMDLDHVTIAWNLTFYGGDIFLLGPGANQAQVNIINSIIWDSFSGYTDGLDVNYSDAVGTFPPGIGNINEDPLFTDPGNGEYTLQWPNPAYPWYGIKSPCIDSGDPASQTDADGTRADMGAYTFNQPNTPLSGTLTNDLIATESPYFVYGDLLVPSGETINIEEGVLLVFQDEYDFTVNGSLQSIGIAGDSIRFTVPDTTGFVSGSYKGWDGLKFYWANGSQMLDYCIIEYSKGDGINCEHSNLDVNNCLIRKNSSIGIYIVDGSVLNLHNSVIEENKGDGLYIEYYSNLNATNTTTKNNLNRGIFMEGTIDVVLNDFNSTGNGGAGVAVGFRSSLLYSGGLVSNNHDGGILDDGFLIDITLEDLIVQGNKKIGNGGGVSSVGDIYEPPHITGNNVLIDNNTATSGGGIYCSYSTVVLDSTIISNNEADTLTGIGGGISANTDSFTVTNSSIRHCNASLGGGFYCDGSSLNINNVIIDSCQAEDGGGLYLSGDIPAGISFSQISNNIASNDGGGIYINNSSVDLDISNTTICSNNSGNYGNAIFTYSSIEPSLHNSIIWSHNEPAIGGYTGVIANYCDIQGAVIYPGSGNINQDPLFVDPDFGDYHLSWPNPPWGIKSPCINKGDPGSPPDPDGTRVDMGLYPNYQTFSSIPGNISDTLKCSESPYYVVEDITIPQDEKLVIEPCTHVILANDYSLNIEGQILAVGNVFDSIRFYPGDTVSGWQGIRFNNQNNKGQDSSILEYCKIQYGHADGTGNNAYGGGIFCKNYSNVSIKHSEISNCNAEWGSGIYSDSSSIFINDCIIKNNTSISGGGGAYFENSSGNLKEVNFSQNIAPTGAGVYISNSNLVLSNYVFDSNEGIYNGGGLFITDSSIVNFLSGEIKYNSLSGVPTIQGKGGGIYISENSILYIDSTNIYSNSAAYYGGGIYMLNSDLTIYNSQISYNHANNPWVFPIPWGNDIPYPAYAGGIYAGGESSIVAEFLLISHNGAKATGGGISIGSTTSVELTNATISQNHGENVYYLGFNGNNAIANGSTNPVYLKNCIIYNNSGWTPVAGQIDATYSLICDFAGAGNICDNPLFSPGFYLAWDNFPNGTKSPCIDSGDPNSPLDPDGTRADMGAFPYDQYYELDLKTFLEGPFDTSQMIPYLNADQTIPLSQPYHFSPWDYFGTENVPEIPNEDIIDWLLVELRDANSADSATSNTVFDQCALFLKKDGSVVGLDGINFPRFYPNLTNDLYVVVKHRNHLSVLSSAPPVLNGRIYSYDFTNGGDKVFGGDKAHKQLSPGIWGMMSADGNADGNIDNMDKNDVWCLQRSLSGYLKGDFDMNSEVENNDKLLWEENVGKSSFVPE